MNQQINSIQISISETPEEACELFLKDLKIWAYDCIERYEDRLPTENHDQLTYVTGWEPYIMASRDKHVIDFLISEQEKTADHFRKTDLWKHGYWRMQEAHHGTEHFELFLGFITRVLPDNETTVSQLIDAVEHIGNWSKEIPEWFDYSTGLFRSLYFGTDGVRADEYELNMPDHLRCANLLMLAYNVTKDSKYFQLAEAYSELWAEAICNPGKPLPIGINRDGPIYELTGSSEETYRSFAGMAGMLDNELDRAENILASGGIQLFLKIWKVGKRDIFLRAANRLLTIISTALNDVDAGPVADLIRFYRNVTGNRDLDLIIIQATENLKPFEIQSIGLDLPENLKKRPPGVGKRSDMPVWYENGKPRTHNPILLSLAAEISEDPMLATRAVDIARAYFNLATQLLEDGRHHGCAARTVSAVARGHGRNNHSGMATAVLMPIIK